MNFCRRLCAVFCYAPHKRAEDFLASWLAVLIGTPTLVTFSYGWWQAISLLVEKLPHSTFGSWIVLFWVIILFTGLSVIGFALVMSLLLPRDLKDFNLRLPAESELESWGR